jgi:hypothetical protein
MSDVGRKDEDYEIPPEKLRRRSMQIGYITTMMPSQIQWDYELMLFKAMVVPFKAEDGKTREYSNKTKIKYFVILETDDGSQKKKTAELVVPILQTDSTAEDFARWNKFLHEQVYALNTCRSYSARKKTIKEMLDITLQKTFEEAIAEVRNNDRKYNLPEEPADRDNAILRAAINQVGRKHFTTECADPPYALKFYLIHLSPVEVWESDIRSWQDRFNELNDLIPYLPPREVTVAEYEKTGITEAVQERSLNEEDKAMVIRQAININWVDYIDSTRADEERTMQSGSWHEVVKLYRELEDRKRRNLSRKRMTKRFKNMELVEKPSGNKRSNNGGSKNSKDDDRKSKKPKKGNHENKKKNDKKHCSWCDDHGLNPHHWPNKCFNNPKSDGYDKKKAKTGKKKEDGNQSKSPNKVQKMSTEEFNHKISQLPSHKQVTKTPKRPVHVDQSMLTNSEDSSNSSINKSKEPKRLNKESTQNHTNSKANRSEKDGSDDGDSTSSIDSEPKNLQQILGAMQNITDLYDNESSDEDCDYCYAINPRIPNPSDSTSNQSSKKKRRCCEILVIVEDPRENTEKVEAIRALLDSGSSGSIILRKHVPKRLLKYHSKKPHKWNTMAGQFKTNRQALINFKMPEFHKHRTVEYDFHVDEHTNADEALYDMIIGADLMDELGIDLLFSENVVKWEGVFTPMKPMGTLSKITNDEQQENSNDEDFVEESYQEYLHQLYFDGPAIQATEERHQEILDADYEAMDIDDYVRKQTHLPLHEQNALHELLTEFPELFSGGLGKLNVPPVHLELKKDAQPFHARPYPIPQSKKKVTKKEIDRLESIDVIEKDDDTEWAAPSMSIPKKTGDIRVVTDFRKLNEYLVRKPYPLPKISELLQTLQGFRYATALDLSMGYYHIPLDEASQKLCATVFPWGKYKYKRLPMGIKNSPDIFQSVMNRLLGDLDFVKIYLDDVIITSNGSFADHMEKVRLVLERLNKANFRVNLKKSFFAQEELEYLGYIISREGIKPQPKKVEAILRLQPPQGVRDLRRFLGMVNFYRDLWRRRSHILAPLTAMCGKGAKFEWTDKCQEAFDEIKRVMSKEVTLAFPDFEKEFHIYADASDYQLGGVIMQDDKPLAFYSRKMNSAQQNYGTGQQELLSIVETLKEFECILLGQEITIHTDHLNLLYENTKNKRLLRWRLTLEEFAPKFVHIKGEKNVVADCLSRHPADFPPEDAIAAENGEHSERLLTYALQPSDSDDEKLPMAPAVLYKHQQADTTLKRRMNTSKEDKFAITNLEGYDLITEDGKIAVPISLQARIVAWYHEYLSHPGQNRTEQTIRQHFTWPKLRQQVEQYCKTCKNCQMNKRQKKKYGHLPAKQPDAIPVPWKRVDVDLIGPYTLKTPTKVWTLMCLTMIDPATGWFEVIDLKGDIEDKTKSSNSVMSAFDETWLCRYPRPQEIGFDNGSEFKSVFMEMCNNYQMKPKHSTAYNPQSNGIIERIHQVLGNMLRSYEMDKEDLNENNPWGYFLNSAAWAIRSTYHTTLEATPAQLVFGRDMILPVVYRADWTRIAEKKKRRIEENNSRENAKRIKHTYEKGDKVLLENPEKIGKLARNKYLGPYEILEVYSNGTIRIQRGRVKETINIRRAHPYYQRI